MTHRHSVAHAKNNLPALIHDVELGAAVEITRRGRAVAVLLSMGEYQRLSGSEPDLWEKLQAFRAAHDLAELELDSVLDDLRDRSPGREFRW